VTYYPAFPLWHSIRIRFNILRGNHFGIPAGNLSVNGKWKCFLSIEQRWENLRVSSFGIFYVSACASWLVDSEILLLPCCLCLAILSDPNVCIHLRKGPGASEVQPFHFKTYTDAPSQPEEIRSDDAGFSGCCAPFCILRAS